MRQRPHILVAMTYWFEPLYAGIARKAAEYGWVLDDALRWQHELPETDRTWDGAIVFAWKNRPLIERLRNARMPLVDMEDYVDHFDASKVVGDDDAVGRIAADHLIRAGCRSLAFVSTPPFSPVTLRRMDGFGKAAVGAGIPSTIVHDVGSVAGFSGRNPQPVGFFGNVDKTALEIENALLDAGIRIPDEAAVLGANDTAHLCEIAPVALSSVNMNFEGKGEAAAMLMHELLARPGLAPRRIVVPPRGVTARASTRRVRDDANDPYSRLLAAMERLCGEADGVEAICRAAGLSVPEARKLVRERLGRTLVEELARTRVRLAKTLLADEKKTLDDVAGSSGFGSRQALYLAFRKFEGRSPAEFRKQ